MSNLTSYEFESKILKNNYKEYLGAAATTVGGTNQNLNEDLKVINQGIHFNKVKQEPNNNRVEIKYKINL